VLGKLWKEKVAISDNFSLSVAPPGLLFNYLQNAGAINEFSANTLGPFKSQLTGHSENTLRTEVLNNIIDVKKGNIGDQEHIIKDPDFNLILVRRVMSSILVQIDEDLEKNQKLRGNIKL